jgi:hypothetical protein
MLEIDRWLKWQPSPKKLDVSPGCEPSKPAKQHSGSFGGSVSEETQDFSEHAVVASNALREDFARWLDSACVCAPRWFGGVSRLHIAFCEQEVQRGRVPSTRNTFERLLAERGFLIGEVAGVVLVSGLVFREDFEVYR